MVDHRRLVPSTRELLADPHLDEARKRLGPELVKQLVHDVQDRARRGELPAKDVLDTCIDALPGGATSLRRTINATGVLVHTNLGRAPLSVAAVAALGQAAGTTDVEMDLATGARGRRGAGALNALARLVPDAEAVHVVNNGAAALALAATVLGRGREFVVARGELVEIGDGFRIPELLEASGVRLREVGTTNRVRLDDYAEAVGPATAFVLKVHPSNFVVSGFTSTVPVAQLATLAVPVVADIGSGLLKPHPRLPHEPDAATTLREGAALVTASGDKLLGGPQAGLLLGRDDIVQRLRRHPLARAVRVDKLTLAGLEATLRGPLPPVMSALERPLAELRRRAEVVATELARNGIPAAVVPSRGAVGGGGAPGVTLDSVAVAVDERLAGPLRLGRPGVVGRVEHGRLLLDLLAVDPEQDTELLSAVVRAVATPRT